MTTSLERLRRALKPVNDALARTTGYRVARAGAFPHDCDPEARGIIQSVLPYTLTSPERIYALITAVRYIHDNGIDGSLVECGVWRGGSMQAAALTLLGRRAATRDLYLFDTFTGMTRPNDRDHPVGADDSAETLVARDPSLLARASLEDVKAGMARVAYPSERVHYVVGDVLTTIPSQAPEGISLLRLDTDWYTSTRHELTHLFPRVVSGGVLIVDDYGDWQGARDATDEVLRDAGLLLVRVAGARIAVKP
jgi:hypothetical protein